MRTPNIRSYEPIVPMIYAYSHPDYFPHDGWTKIGYTEKQRVEERVRQQHHTSDIAYKILWRDNAIFKDGSGKAFTDRAFHRWLTRCKGVEQKPGTEWFRVDGPRSRELFEQFAQRQPLGSGVDEDYTLRAEQARAVKMTADYFRKGGEEFLWNAKPRFGKTLSAYDLVRRMNARKVLIVTNRPSIANSWAEDFLKFIAWRDELYFVSDSEVMRGHPAVMSRAEYLSFLEQDAPEQRRGMIAFESLQGLKDSVWFGGQSRSPRVRWISELEFDLLIVDESHEGVETLRTERAFRSISRKHTLYLSGTPFRQLAGDQFSDEQIFNWSYADEQEAKRRWHGDGFNPYEPLPQLLMYTYQLGPMVYDRLRQGIVLEDEEEAVDPAFDLNEFFLTDDNGKLLHRDDVKKFLLTLFTGEKYPFSTPELRRELAHTMWYLNRVASAKALFKLMREDPELKPLFAEYEIVLAAGDGKLSEDEEAQKSYDKVKAAIAAHEKTITLTVGQLTVGVTVPEWSGVFMLCNLKSPSSYMQAAFRAQNPHSFRAAGTSWRKERAYLFDFDPARTLIIYDQFANNLIRKTATGGTTEDREENIRRLLNFFPVLGEDEEGRMVELDAAQVLTIPRKLKSAEVVRHGFMSNFLFANISGIFGAPGIVRRILEQLPLAHEETNKARRGDLDGMERVRVDADGSAVPDRELVIGKTRELFGDKIYETVPAELEAAVSSVAESSEAGDVARHVRAVTDAVKSRVAEDIIAPIADSYGMTQKAQKRLAEQTGREIERAMAHVKDDFEQRRRIAEAELDAKRRSAETEQEAQTAETAFAEELDEAMKALTDSISETVQKTLQEKPQELVERLETKKAEDEKKTKEDAVRDHLRGFARTIPSFLMAYGDENLTLANFDSYVEDDVFQAVSAITKEQFRFLRDGGDWPDPETGVPEHYDGHLFDEGVFNDSVREFLRKRRELADYFDESRTEDIFDYIPPQKTNQIFTPRRIVKLMVDKLEEENPGCFDDPEKTFADLYMKSGLYITEIVKRLYRSAGLKAAFPDDKARIRHILRHQVYGMAPTRIIYLIATNYILGFDEALKREDHHFVEADAAEAAKTGTLKELVRKHFG